MDYDLACAMYLFFASPLTALNKMISLGIPQSRPPEVCERRLCNGVKKQSRVLVDPHVKPNGKLPCSKLPFGK